MDIVQTRKRYQSLVDTLRPYAPCWNQSVLQSWPVCRDVLPPEWLESLRSLSLVDLHQLDDCISSAGQLIPASQLDNIPPSLCQFLTELEPLLKFAPAPVSPEESFAQNLRMTAKKQQELAAILPFVRSLVAKGDLERAVDIGGGVGHLARALVVRLGLPVVSLDRDPALQNLGRSLLQSQAMDERASRLCFVQTELQAQEQPGIDGYFQGPCLSLGLHTCGPLALTHLRKSHASLCLLNFGCCYDRMDPERDCQQSDFARAHPLPWTSYALFLATRGRLRTLNELAMQEKVNSYRLGLHLLLVHLGLTDGFISVGDAPRGAYLSGFVAYAEHRLAALGWASRYDQDAIQQFAADPSVQRSMREFFLINILRNCFARPLEVLILLDRVLWLMEQGREVDLLQFFDPKVSPRNLGIFARFYDRQSSEPLGSRL